MLTSSSVLEHLPNVGGFLDEAARVLKEYAVMIHIFPGRYASFAVLNRVLPEHVKRRMLFASTPRPKGFVASLRSTTIVTRAMVEECARVASTSSSRSGTTDPRTTSRCSSRVPGFLPLGALRPRHRSARPGRPGAARRNAARDEAGLKRRRPRSRAAAVSPSSCLSPRPAGSSGRAGGGSHRGRPAPDRRRR